MLESIGKRGRAFVCVVFFGGEALLIGTAKMRSDRSYGFQMFPESSTVTTCTSRGGSRDGRGKSRSRRGFWQANDCSGAPHPFVWQKMVRAPAPWRLDAPVGAPYGTESEVHRAREALRWVTEHTPDDCETQSFAAEVYLHKNGRSTGSVTFEVEHVR